MEAPTKTAHNTRFLHVQQGAGLGPQLRPAAPATAPFPPFPHSPLNLLRTLSTVSGMTLLSRIAGLLRETLKATVFGAGLQMDAFEAAFRLPNLLRRLFAEGAFSQAFVPILAEYQRKRGHEATQDLVDHVATLLGLILFGVTVIGVLAAPVLVYISAPGFAATPQKFDLTVQLLRLTFPYILLVS